MNLNQPRKRLIRLVKAATACLLALQLALPETAFAQPAATPATPAAANPATKPKAKPAPIVSKEAAAAAQTLFEAGRRFYFQGKHADAIAKLAAAVDKHPGKTTYRLLLAKAYREAGQRNKAITLLTDILKANPEHAESGIALAELFDPIKEPDRVIDTLEPLLKFKHDYPMYHLLAEAHYEKDDLDKAREYFLEATKLNPRAGSDFYQLGNIYLVQSRFARAATAYEKAGALGIHNDVYHFKLATVYFNLRNYVGTIAEARIIGGKPGDIRDRMLIIDAVPGKPDTFYVASPKSAAYQVVLARQMGIKLDALRFLEANIWLGARRYAMADTIYKTLKGKLDKADEGLFWFYWAQTALGLNQYEAYLERLTKAIDVEPDVYKPTLGDAYITIANRHHQRGDRDKYILYLGKAVEISPLSASLHRTLGDAHWESGDRPAAIKQYRLVLELEPDHRDRVLLLNRIRGQSDPPTS